jgi:hypothetical protein
VVATGKWLTIRAAAQQAMTPTADQAAG